MQRIIGLITEAIDFDIDLDIDLEDCNLKCIKFINQNTTIECILDTEENGTFWDGICIFKNKIIVNPEMAHPGDLLHEAGHLATIPISSRYEIAHDLDCMPELIKLVRDTRLPYGCDHAATGWAYAACLSMELSTLLPFENGYEYPNVKHATCQSPSSMFGYSLMLLGLLPCFTNKWDMKYWDINLLNK